MMSPVLTAADCVAVHGRSQAQHGEATLAETLQKSSKATGELAAVRQENQALMKVSCNQVLELVVPRR